MCDAQDIEKEKRSIYVEPCKQRPLRRGMLTITILTILHVCQEKRVPAITSY